jgi:pimeloyl-ACP methyl ester carboxylesterase
MARSLAQKGSVDRGLLLVGEEDTLSPSSAARELADAAGWEFRSIAGAAHAVPIEQAVIWRRAVLEFLDRSE